MSQTEIIRVMDTDTPVELRELLAGAFQEKPDKKGLQELRRILKAHPELWHHVIDYADIVRSKLIDRIFTQESAQLGLEANITDMQQGM